MGRRLAILFIATLAASCAQPPVAPPGPATDTATLLFKSQGEAMNVAFHTSSEAQPCAGLTRTANVYDAVLLQQNLLPAMATMIRKTQAWLKVYPAVELKVKGGMPFQVLGSSNWSGTGAGVTTYGKCGPLTLRFTPHAGRSYLVLFKFTGNGCTQSVQDTTDAHDPSAGVAVETTPLHCTRPVFS